MGDLSPNFDRSEFACQCGCGFHTVDWQLLTILEKLRSHLWYFAGEEVSCIINIDDISKDIEYLL